MPLLQKDSNDTIKITVDMVKEGGVLYEHFAKNEPDQEDETNTKAGLQRIIDDMGNDWYEILADIGWYRRVQLNDLLFSDLTLKQDALNTSIDNAKRRMQMLKIYLVGWSHSEKINEQTLKLIPAGAYRLIMQVIGMVHQLQWGATEDSPLEANSPES